MAIYAKITGKLQGVFKGSATADKHKDEIALDSCEMGIASPHDIATGQAAGKRQWRPVHLVKTLDAATPMLFNALITNEVLTEVLITYWRTGQNGNVTSFVTIKLTNALLFDFNHLENFEGKSVEKLSLSFTKWEFSWLPDSIGAADDWTTQT